MLLLLLLPLLLLLLLQDEERILACFRAALQAGGRRLKLAVVDHVVSFPPVVMPVQEICSMCRCMRVL
jgi:hypothetical protein